MNRNYLLKDGILVPTIPIQHREDEYNEEGFEKLFDMQKRHFWYKGRHRFLIHSVKHFLNKERENKKVNQSNLYSMIDLGGGVGGWVNYLSKHLENYISTLALADSSLKALNLAESVISSETSRFQVDLMKLQMKEEWDVAFLLDVIEHLPDDIEAMKQTAEALKPGGYLFVTTPAFQEFWSYNDDMANHIRRYNQNDYVNLAKESGLKLCDARYFMFYLSPLYIISRLIKNIEKMTLEEKKALVINQHKIPPKMINDLLTMIFSLETPIGHWLKFPWGTSILGVFQKP